MKNNDVMIEVNFSDYAKHKASYTKEELLNIIRHIRADTRPISNSIREEIKNYGNI